MALQEILQGFWIDLISRPSGPLALRFLLQPVMATVFAIRDGMKDAREGRSPYFWTVLSRPEERRARLREGLKSTGKILVLAVILDAIYQIVEFRAFHPVQALVVAFVLGFVPYVLIRGPAARLARWRS